MYRLPLFLLPACLWLFAACNPPVRLIPKTVKTGLDSTEYAAAVENTRDIDLRSAKFLAKVKVVDLGISLDCAYSDIIGFALEKTRSIGGNLLLITEHQQNSVKSNCHTIKGDIYAIPALEGIESQIRWHAKRPLLAGDLRGRPAKTQTGNFPPLYCTISCRVGGDYYKEAILRTETIFYTDSTYQPADPTLLPFALRRAQLYFDLAELHVRQLKSALVGLGSDLPAVTSQFRPMTTRQQAALKQQEAAFEAELAAGDANAVLARWENKVRGDLAALDGFFGNIRIDLRKKKKK